MQMIAIFLKKLELFNTGSKQKKETLGIQPN